RRNKSRTPNVVEPELRTIVEVAPMADNQTMEELLQAPMKGEPYHGFERENPHTHINNSKRITSTLKFKDVSNDVIKLMMFPYSLEGAARVWENAIKPDDWIDNLADQISNLVDIVSKKVVTSATVKAVEESCVFVVGEMKAITTQSGAAYEGPSIPTNTSPKKVVERETEETIDKEQTNFQRSTAHIQPLVIPILDVNVPRTLPKPNIPYPSRLNDQRLCEKATNQMEKFFQNFQDFHFDISFADALLLMPKFASMIKSLLVNKDKLFELAKTSLRMDVCHALADLGASINLIPLFIWKKLSLPELTPTRMTLELVDRSITRPKGVAEDVFIKVGKFHIPTNFVVVDFDDDPSVPLILGRSFLRTGRALIDVDEEEITLRVNDEAVTFNLNQTTRYSSTYDDISVNRIDVIDVAREEYAQEMLGFSKNSSEIEAYLKDESISLKIDHADCDLEGDICLIEKMLNYYPFQLPSIDLKQGEVAKAKYSIEEPLELELKDLPSYLEYAYLEGTDKLLVIIAKDLNDDEKEAHLKVLKSHQRAIAWKITDIKGIGPRFCTHKILMEEDYKPTVQSQRWVNPKIHEIIKKEVIKLLDAGMIYPISDSPWVSPIHCVPKKGRISVVENENNELMHARLVTDGFSGYFRIPINPPDPEKTTFTCPYRTFAYRRMPFGLCNAPGTFQRCMMAIFHDMIEKTMEVFMDDFSVFGDSFSSCLHHLDTMLKRLEVDRAKVDVIAKLPHPTTVKGVRRVVGHAGFYRRFIQDFSKIARPMTHLLKKETPFVFSKDCIDAFEILKKKLTEAPILVFPNWNLPFELMCDASDFAIGAVLGQRKTKNFQPIHYASKIMIEAQIHYTTTEKEMLAVVYAFEKFRPYLVLSKSIVYTDHSALKYLLSKQDAKPRFLWWFLLLQEFDIIIRDKKGTENFATDHLSRLENPHNDVLENKDINENFPLETLVMSKYGVTHLLATAYHPQTSRQVEVSNRGLKRILERTVGENHASWSKKLEDALWAFRTAYKTPIGCTPYKLVYRKSCHLPIELEHKAYWALKHVDFDLKTVGDHRKLQLNELNKLRDQAYENSLIYKQKTKKLHDFTIKNRIFNVGDRVLLFNSSLKIFSRKLKTRWAGPFTITRVFPYGTIE
nr:reverse transcriptase domain-containing protein [Tanacetum cinerariifolium]